MRKTSGDDQVLCRKCPRTTNHPRLGLCFACYQRERRGSVLHTHAACKRCGETDRVVLRVTPLGVLCANDHARARAAVA